ncbi:ureidoglycolate lyase [Pontiella agarivorans]|uniref:Ureidoglycolate hydrolase n=1 Tax=Pontiella agarivorans TaxID=3038953 RepID=A0ABU5MX31_9BACT|nr:ureidoglycolate lyase [Pontiella agarivorans]MDZ8118526.1 hypothetical protein [Pontiella agarivorans]
MDVKIEPITKSAFAEYGQLLETPPAAEPTIAVPTVNFWKQQAAFTVDGELEVGFLNVKKMDMIFDDLENHFKTQTGLISLSGDWCIGVGTPGNEVPEAGSLKAFRIPKGRLVVLHEKCWHTTPYPVDHDESAMLVMCKKDFLDDDTVYEKISEESRLVF